MGGLFGGGAAKAPHVQAAPTPVNTPPPNLNGAQAGEQSKQVASDTTPLNPGALSRSQFLGY